MAQNANAEEGKGSFNKNNNKLKAWASENEGWKDK
jgi:hypothetical protein